MPLPTLQGKKRSRFPRKRTKILLNKVVKVVNRVFVTFLERSMAVEVIIC